MRKTFNLGSVFCIRLRLRYIGLVILVLTVVLSVYPAYSQWFYWVMGVIAGLLCFALMIACDNLTLLISSGSESGV